MSNVQQTAAGGPARRGGSFLNWKVMLLVAIVLIAAAGGGAYYMFGSRLLGHPQQVAKVKQEAPLPYFLEVKPFVVSMVNDAGNPHFVQIGVNFTMAGPAIGNLVTALQPEVTDAMRQTALNFKVEDVVTPKGVDKLRAAMLVDVNRVLLQRLGAERIKSATGGEEKAVRQIYFTTLIVE